MKTVRKLSALVLVMMLVLSLTNFTAAYDVPDLTKTGTIHVTMCTGVTPVGGGSLTLYRVGQIVENDGDYNFVPTGDFAGWDGEFDNTQLAVQAAELAKIAAKLPADAGLTQSIAADGTASFDDLELGLYLVVQKEPAPGYKPINPFLVSLPTLDKETYIYTVNASPKVALEELPPEPTKPGGGGNTAQTGQINWPIPILTAAGLLLFGVGLILCFPRKKKNEE